MYVYVLVSVCIYAYIFSLFLVRFYVSPQPHIAPPPLPLLLTLPHIAPALHQPCVSRYRTETKTKIVRARAVTGIQLEVQI